MALSEPEILNGIAEVINEETGVAINLVRLEKKLQADLGIDPGMLNTIIDVIDVRFETNIPAEDASRFRLVGDIVSYIQAEQE